MEFYSVIDGTILFNRKKNISGASQLLLLEKAIIMGNLILEENHLPSALLKNREINRIFDNFLSQLHIRSVLMKLPLYVDTFYVFM